MFKKKVLPVITTNDDLKIENTNYKNHNLERDEIIKMFYKTFLDEFNNFFYYFKEHSINTMGSYKHSQNIDEFLKQIEDYKQIHFINLTKYFNYDLPDWNKIFKDLNLSNMKYIDKINWILSVYDFVVSNYSTFSHNFGGNIEILSIFHRTTKFLECCEQHGFVYKNGTISYSENVLNVISLGDESFTRLYLKFIRENDFEKKHGLMFEIQGKILWIFGKHSPVFNEFKKYFNNDYLNNFQGMVQGYIRHTEQDSINLEKWIVEWEKFDIDTKIKIMNDISCSLIYGASISKNYGTDPFSAKKERERK